MSGEVGWHILPCDYPLEGGLGYHVWRVVDDEEEARNFVFYPLGRMTTESEVLTDAVEFCQFASSPGTFPCDDPRRRRLGAVRYDAERCVATVKYLGILDLKKATDLPPEVRERFHTNEDRGQQAFEAEKQRLQEYLAA
jgi:hypothetical protein